jgi:hypothetical protein
MKMAERVGHLVQDAQRVGHGERSFSPQQLAQ